MSRFPRKLWQRLPEALKQQIVQEFTTLFEDVLHEHLRHHSADAPSSPGHRLRSPVQPEPLECPLDEVF